MAKTAYKSLDEYIAAHDATEQKVLQKMRQTIRKAVPEAEEVISYQVPAFKYNGWIFYFGAYTNHYSISCPPPFTVFDAFKKDLAPYEMSKSTIQFPKSKPFPYELLLKMSKFRAKENIKKAEVKKKPKAR